MSSDYKDNKFKELLDKLQQESWQLELIISGFAIFGLFTAFPEIKLAMKVAQNQEQIYFFPILLIALIACSILLFNLLIHVVLRGLWIGALGLRYVSGDIDFKKLNYQSRFTRYLKKKIVSFDKYVATLENYCSVLFATSFLLIFYVISITIIILCIVGIATLIIDNDNLPKNARSIIGAILIIFTLFGSFLLLVDFFTQGYLKKKKWLSKIYFPFYWVFSFLTLSFLYRPLVYNFLDNKFTKRLRFILVPAYIVILILISFKYKNSNYINSMQYVNEVYSSNDKYENLLTREDDFVKNVTIQSKVITEPYLKLFRVFNENVEDRIFNFHPTLKPKKDKRGFKTDIVFISDEDFSSKKRDSLAIVYLKVFNETHEVFIDTLKYKSDFIITKNSKNQLGFETYINIKNLKDGKHLLKFKRYRKKKQDTVLATQTTIPFWYYKN